MQRNTSHHLVNFHYRPLNVEDHIVCDWKSLRQQILFQWDKLQEKDMDMAGPSRFRVASLISQKYGIAYPYVENYLRNFERTMPL